jgi:lipid-A-disaccharide synthase
VDAPSTELARARPFAFFVTGEASGDRHAAPVAAELLGRGWRVDGVGGPWMKAAGVALVQDSTHWGAMGVPESARKAPGLYVRSRLLLLHIRRLAPDVVVLVDFGFFNVRLARLLRRFTRARIFYYFPPGSWRQQPRDWSRLAALADCIATPFARNAEFLTASGAHAHWVGHPVVDSLEPVADRAAFREANGLPRGEPVIGLLAGSRRMERQWLGPVMLDAAARLRARFPAARFAWSSFPRLGALEARLARQAAATGYIDLVEDGYALLRGCDLVLVAMGTATLEAAAAVTPMVTAYDGPALGKWLAVRVLRQTQPFYAMPNILLGRLAVPEIVPADYRDRITGERLAGAAEALLADRGRLEAMRQDLRQVRAALGEPGVARRTAELIETLASPGQP